MFSKYGWLICLLLFFFSVAYWGFSLSGQIAATPDNCFIDYPRKIIVSDFLRKGLIPLWNPYLACGTPLLADYQSACFYPFTWIRTWFDPSNSFEGISLLHELFAFAGFYLWLRCNRIERTWCVLGAMGFAGSAQMVICWGYNTLQANLAWMPWVFWSAQSFLERGGINRWILTTLIFSLQLLSGYPPFSFYTFIFLGVYVMCFRVGIDAKGRLLLCGAASLFLTSVQWIPFIEFLANGKRVFGMDNPYHFSLADFSRLTYPFLGNIGSAEYRGLNENAPFNPYIGIPALVLFIGSLFQRKYFWGISSLLILVWLAGHNGPAGWLMPGKIVNALEPAKATFLFVFCAITASAHAGNRWFDVRGRTKKLVTLIVVAAWVLDLLVLPFRIRQHMPNPYTNSSTLAVAQTVKNIAGEGRILQVLTSSDFFSLSQEPLPQRMLNGVQMIQPNSSGVFGIRTLAGNLTLVANGFMNLVRYGDKAYPYRGRLFDVAGIKVFIAKKKMPGPKYEPLPIGKNIFLNVNRDSLSSLRKVDGARYFGNRPAVLEATALENADVEKEVYLEKDSNGEMASLPPGGRRWIVENPGEIKFLRYSPQRAFWSGEADPGSYVVFNETFFPGWKAWLDGAPIPIDRAYGQFMAVRVEKGLTHRIDFGFEPTSFRLGLFLTLCSLSIVLGMCRLPRDKQNRPVLLFRTS